MGINIRQEGHDCSDNKWFITIEEKWYVFDQKQEDELTQFLRRNQIPYGINYTFEGIIFELHTKGTAISNFKNMIEQVTKLLEFKNTFVNPKPDPNLLAECDQIVKTHPQGAFLGNPDITPSKIPLSDAERYGLMPTGPDDEPEPYDTDEDSFQESTNFAPEHEFENHTPFPEDLYAMTKKQVGRPKKK